MNDKQRDIYNQVWAEAAGDYSNQFDIEKFANRLGIKTNQDRLGSFQHASIFVENGVYTLTTCCRTYSGIKRIGAAILTSVFILHKSFLDNKKEITLTDPSTMRYFLPRDATNEDAPIIKSAEKLAREIMMPEDKFRKAVEVCPRTDVLTEAFAVPTASVIIRQNELIGYYHNFS